MTVEEWPRGHDSQRRQHCARESYPEAEIDVLFDKPDNQRCQLDTQVSVRDYQNSVWTWAYREQCEQDIRRELS